MLREGIIAFKAGKTISILVALIMITQTGLAIAQAWIPDPQPDYQLEVMPTVQHCSLASYPTSALDALDKNGNGYFTGKFTTARDPLKWYLNCLSFKVFGTPKLIPIFFNVGLIPLFYLLAKELTKDKMVTLIALLAFVANPLYTQWIASGTYDQTWSFFLILSAYLILKSKSYLSIPSFMLSITAKTLGFLYLPSFVYMVWVHTKDRLITIGLVLVCLVPFVVIASDPSSSFIFGGELGFHPENFHSAFVDNFGMLAYELPFLMIFGYLSWKYPPKKPNPARKLCAVWIVNAWFITTIIYLFSNQFQFVYRFVPLAVFMSIFIAITINDLARYYIEQKLEKPTV